MIWPDLEAGYCGTLGNRGNGNGFGYGSWFGDIMGGGSFTEHCVYAAEDGRNWRPDCIAQVTSCGDVAMASETPEGQSCQSTTQKQTP